MKRSAVLLGLAAGFLVLIYPAMAGVRHWGSLPTEAESCWLAEAKANEAAAIAHTCYTSCICSSRANGFDCYSDSDNYDSGCRIAGHQRPTANFRPNPTLAVRTPAPTPAPSPGNASIDFQPDTPGQNYATAVITNRGGSDATVSFEIWARDTNYSFPERVIAAETLTIPAGQTVTRQYHSWHAVDWKLKRIG